MKVDVEVNFLRCTISVWVIERGTHGLSVLRFVPDDKDDDPTRGWPRGPWQWEPVDEALGAPKAPPTIELPEYIFEAIVAAGADVLPPDRAQAAHLADATAVRDRLMVLVETIITDRFGPTAASPLVTRQ